MLLVDPLAGWAVLAGILIQIIVNKKAKTKDNQTMIIIAAGIIAGDALYSFFTSIVNIGR